MAGIIVIIITVLGVAIAQDFYEERHKYQVLQQFTEIPRHFEVTGPNALATFKQYIPNIENLASKNNSRITYKVEVQITKENKQKIKKGKQKRSKKFNVPLKKKNMKLSSFEIELRKYVSDSFHKKISDFSTISTEYKTVQQQATTQRGTGKFKPVINGVKTKYTKRVKPVRNNLISLK